MPCDAHLSKKKGDCIDCGKCKLCAAPRRCQRKENHNTNTKRGRPFLSVAAAKVKKLKRNKNYKIRELPFREAAYNAEVGNNNTSIYLTHHSDSESDTTTDATVEGAAELEIKTNAILDALSCTPNNESIPSNESSKKRNAAVQLLKKNTAYPIKEKLIKLLVLLDIPLDENIDRFPSNGFKSENFSDPTSRQCKRARSFHSSIHRKIDELLCPSSPEVLGTLLNPFFKMKKTMENKLVKNLTKVAVEGHKTSSIIANSIMASTYNLFELQTILFNERQLNEAIPRSRYHIAEKRFASLRKTFNEISIGNMPAKRDYAYRVDPTKIHSALAFLQSSLQVRAGAIRSITFAGFQFNGLPVYTRGGINVENLHATYCKSIGEEKPLGMNTFGQFTKLMTTRGIEKTGLSTYYVRLKYASSIYISMLKRLQMIPEIANKVGIFGPADQNTIQNLATNETINEHTDDTRTEIWTIKKDCNLLIDKWNETMQFLSYQFSEKNLKLDSECSVLCCRFGVNLIPTCNHVHEMQQCKHSIDALTAVDPFGQLLNTIDIVNNTDVNEEICYEVISMQKTIPNIKMQMKNYMSHRVRAKVQFSAINTIYKKLTDDNALVVFDHKQKVLPRQFREGQVDYFGKRGMSLIGAMLVRRIEKNIKGENIFGLEYQFIDCIMEQYSSQDSMQVMATIQIVVENIQSRYPNIKKLTLQSDNASCFASHDNIPYIHHLNKELETKMMDIRIVRWIYTEAQTGKGKLDTHFSYVNTLFESYVEDGNDILTEKDIYLSLKFQGGIKGSTSILIDGSLLSANNKVLQGKSFKTKKIGVRETHDIKWKKRIKLAEPSIVFVEVYTLSDITVPEIINELTLEKFPKYNLIVNAIQSHTSSKEAMFVPDNKQVINHHQQNNNTNLKAGSKAASIVAALDQVGIEYNLQLKDNVIEKIEDHSNNVYQGWACYPKTKKGEPLSVNTLEVLKQLYDNGVSDKSKKVSADRAHVIITEQESARDWYERIICTVARVKVFFSTSPNKMQDLIEKSRKIEELERIESEELQPQHDGFATAHTNNEQILTSPVINRNLDAIPRTGTDINNIDDDDIYDTTTILNLNEILDEILDENNENEEDLTGELEDRELENIEVEMLHDLLTVDDVE